MAREEESQMDLGRECRREGARQKLVHGSAGRIAGGSVVVEKVREVGGSLVMASLVFDEKEFELNL